MELTTLTEGNMNATTTETRVKPIRKPKVVELAIKWLEENPGTFTHSELAKGLDRHWRGMARVMEIVGKRGRTDLVERVVSKEKMKQN